jgi:hypothetical protein
MTVPWQEPDFQRWKQPALHSGEAIRQEPREERIGNTVERGDEAADRPNATPKGPGSLVSWVRRKACPYF